MSGTAEDLRAVARRAPAAACDPSTPRGCAICGDEALPARVLSVDGRTHTATVLFRDDGRPIGQIEAALDLVDGVSVGDVVLVHQGFVISRVAAP